MKCEQEARSSSRPEFWGLLKAPEVLYRDRATVKCNHFLALEMRIYPRQIIHLFIFQRHTVYFPIFQRPTFYFANFQKNVLFSNVHAPLPHPPRFIKWPMSNESTCNLYPCSAKAMDATGAIHNTIDYVRMFDKSQFELIHTEDVRKAL